MRAGRPRTRPRRPPAPPSGSARPANQLVDRPSLLLGGADLKRSPAAPLRFSEAENAPRDELLQRRNHRQHELANPAGSQDPRVAQSGTGLSGAQPVRFEAAAGDPPAVEQHQSLRIRALPIDPDQA